MSKTNIQRLARERQQDTGETYTACLRYVREHQDELIPALIRRRQAARLARLHPTEAATDTVQPGPSTPQEAPRQAP